MFQKKEMIFSENMGVCRVEKIVKLSVEKNADEGISYYVLRTLDGKKSYIPVEHHQVLLRPLLNTEEAKEKLFQAAAVQKARSLPEGGGAKETERFDTAADEELRQPEGTSGTDETMRLAKEILTPQELAEIGYVLGQAEEES